MNKSKITWIILGVLVLLIILVLALVKSRPQPQANNQPAKQSPPAVLEQATASNIQAVSKTQLPKEFPADIPLEKGAEVTLNYNAINPDGSLQATREFVSKKTVSQNFTLYQNALKNSGWTITSSTGDPKLGDAIAAQKNNQQATIRIYLDLASKQVRVSISCVIQR